MPYNLWNVIIFFDQYKRVLIVYQQLHKYFIYYAKKLRRFKKKSKKSYFVIILLKKLTIYYCLSNRWQKKNICYLIFCAIEIVYKVIIDIKLKHGDLIQYDTDLFLNLLNDIGKTFSNFPVLHYYVTTTARCSFVSNFSLENVLFYINYKNMFRLLTITIFYLNCSFFYRRILSNFHKIMFKILLLLCLLKYLKLCLGLDLYRL